MEIILIRHAATAGAAEGRYIGVTDEPLGGEGVWQAVRSGIVPQIPHVYASTLVRTVQTAAIKFPHARMTLIPGLRGMDYGEFERGTHGELLSDPRYLAWLGSDCVTECPRGEGRMRFSMRVCIAFSEVASECLRFGRRSVILVTHESAIRAILERFARPTRAFDDWRADFCGGYRATLDERTWERVPVLTEVTPL